MAEDLTLYLFGDQTYDMQRHAKVLLRNRDKPILEQFLVKAYDAIRVEIYKLPPQIRDSLPRFTCPDDLVQWNHGESCFIPLEMAVTCLFHIGIFIW